MWALRLLCANDSAVGPSGTIPSGLPIPLLSLFQHRWWCYTSHPPLWDASQEKSLLWAEHVKGRACIWREVLIQNLDLGFLLI